MELLEIILRAPLPKSPYDKALQTITQHHGHQCSQDTESVCHHKDASCCPFIATPPSFLTDISPIKVNPASH